MVAGIDGTPNPLLKGAVGMVDDMDAAAAADATALLT